MTGLTGGGATPNWSARALRSRRASGFTGRKLSRLVGAIDSTRGQEVMRPVLGIGTRGLLGGHAARHRRVSLVGRPDWHVAILLVLSTSSRRGIRMASDCRKVAKK